MASPNHIWTGLNTVTELAKKSDIPSAYVHPTTQQCTIPLATTETAGLMSPSDKMKLSTMSYNWTDLEKATLDPQSDYTNYANSSVSAEIDVSKYCKTDLHSCVLVRVEFDVVLEVDGSCGPNPYGTTTLTASVRSCNVVLDSETKSSTNGISINAIQNTVYTQFLIPTSSGYDVYSDQSLSEKVGETYSNEIVIRAMGSISGRPPTRSMSASVSGDVHFYAVL